MTALLPDRPPSVLLDFRASNVRSFRDSIDFTLRSGPLSEPEAVHTVEASSTGHTIGVLPAAAVYGPNGSGKTNLLRAMHDLRSHVLHSFRNPRDPLGGVARKPFLLDDSVRGEPSSFEIDLVLEGVRHEYAFTVDDSRYLTERAHHYPKGRRSLLFERIGDQVTVGAEARAKSKGIGDILRPNALYLSTAAFAGQPALAKLWAWFSRNLILAEARTRAHRQGYTTEMMFHEGRRESVLDLLRVVDPGIVDVTKRTMDPELHQRVRRAVRIITGEEDEPEGSDEAPAIELGILLSHQGAQGERVEFDSEDESLGTLVWYGLLGPVIDALADGCVFLADEIDASLHPQLSRHLIRLFQNPVTNRHRAQLVFNTHDTNLLGDSETQAVGRDQVWLVEKSLTGGSTLTQLTTHSPRKDAALGRRYLLGHFGALPTASDEQVDTAVLEAIARRHDGGRA